MKTRFLLILVWTIAVSFSTTAAWSAEFCVNPSGSGESDLQSALDMADSNGTDDIIKVVQGTYTGNFYYNSGETDALTMEGGYTTGCASREVNPSNTILDGDNNDNVLQIVSSGNSLGDIQVDGFTIKNGNSTSIGGAGLRVSLSTSSEGSGSIFVTNNIIKDNTTTYSGGGVAVYTHGDDSARAGTITFINNIIEGNTSSVWGGGVYINSSSDSYSGETILLLNNTITENSAPHGVNGYGGGIYIYIDDNTINIFNNIIWGNTAGVEGEDIAYSYANPDNSTKNGFYNDYSDMVSGTGETTWDTAIGNIDIDPKLTSTYHLTPNSPCIDAGTNLIPGSPSTDFEGDNRVIDGDRNDEAITDIGADEYIPKGALSFFMLLFD